MTVRNIATADAQGIVASPLRGRILKTEEAAPQPVAGYGLNPQVDLGL
jgi:hypothetical protein